MTSFRPGHNPPQVTMPAHVCFGSKKSCGSRHRPGQFEKKFLRRWQGMCVSNDQLRNAPAVADWASDGRGNRRLAESGYIHCWVFSSGYFVRCCTTPASPEDRSRTSASRLGRTACRRGGRRHATSVLSVFDVRLPSATITFRHKEPRPSGLWLDKSLPEQPEPAPRGRCRLVSRAVSIQRCHGLPAPVPRRQFEVERLPVGIQDRVEQELLWRTPPSTPGCASGRSSRAGSVGPRARQVRASRSRRFRLTRCRSCCTSRNSRRAMSSFTKTMHIRVLFDQRPVEPTGLVVLAIGVVVAALRAPHFVAHQRSSAHPARAA